MEKLALFGGEKTKTTPYGTGKRFDGTELENLKEALEQNTLFYMSGKKNKQLCEKFTKLYGMKHCVTTSSSTASIHVALGALGITAGDEVITTPVTDMGSIIGILSQNAIPVFADIDPHTYNLDPASIERCITDKTKAIVAVHLAGNPADMDAIMAIAKKHNIKVVEDCAQAFMCYYKGKLVGTIGDIGCFSFNEFKHITAGDGGAVMMNDEELFYRAHRFADKNYDRHGREMRKIPFLAPNYRMNELTAAVVVAQLDKVKNICARFNHIGDSITAGISGLKGITPHKVLDSCSATYLFYMFRIDEKELGVDRDTFVKALEAEGLLVGAGYIPECVYEYDMFKNKEAYPGTHCPFDCPYYGRDREYKTGLAPVAEEVLRTGVRFPINGFFTDKDIEETVKAVNKVVAYYASAKK